MTPETIFTININASAMLIGIFAFFIALFAIVWKGKSEISSAIKKELDPTKSLLSSMTNAVIEIHTILKTKFAGLNITHTLVERGGSPLSPTEYGATLIKESGLERILDDNKETLHIKLEASLSANYTDYDVQEHARKLLFDLRNNPIMNPVKEWVYSHPMDIEIILRIGGLWLRDDFLKQPRQINTDKS